MLLRTIRRMFCEWIPNVPKHKIVIDKSSFYQPHPFWDIKDAERDNITHKEPITFGDKYANFTMKYIRKTFDLFTGYNKDQMTEKAYLQRIIFLETIAGVPGMIGAMVRHFKALRSLKRDKGWIHHLLEEAENERMHLFFFLKIRQPGIILRWSIIGGQFIFIVYYSLLYLLSSRVSHRFVGYLEEEAVKTYTRIINDIDNGKLKEWMNQAAPPEAIKYYGLKSDAKMRDMFICVRADEMQHREYNHHFSEISKNEPMKGHRIFVVEENGEQRLEIKK
jgi:rubrerythrin